MQPRPMRLSTAFTLHPFFLPRFEIVMNAIPTIRRLGSGAQSESFPSLWGTRWRNSGDSLFSSRNAPNG